MIGIREVASAIAGIQLTDPAARQVQIHTLLRNYGVELLTNLAQAIAPSNPQEEAVVMWLKDRINEIASQIPHPIPGKPKKEKTQHG